METSHHHEVALANVDAEIRRLHAHLDATFISIESYLAWMPDEELIQIFAAVGNLSHLTTFRISFSFQRFRQLPVLPLPSQTLVATLQAAQGLETLTLDEVRFVFSNNQDIDTLAETLLHQAPNLKHVTLFNCFPVEPPRLLVPPPRGERGVLRHHHRQHHAGREEEEQRGTRRTERRLLHPDPLAVALSSIPSLQELNLIYTILEQENNQGPEEWICSLLRHSCHARNCQKKILRINVPDGTFLGEPIQHMCRSLETNTSTQLQELSIRCPLDDQGGRALALALASPHTALQELYVQMKSYHHAVPIAHALEKHNKRLASFELRVWTGGDRGPLLQAYEQMVPYNAVIQQLIIDNGRLGLTPLIEFYLGLNRAGRRGLLEEGDKLQKSSWIDFLIRFHPDLSVLFYTLSLNPSLCNTYTCGADDELDMPVDDDEPMEDQESSLSNNHGADNNNNMCEEPSQKRQKLQNQQQQQQLNGLTTTNDPLANFDMH